MQVYVNLPKDFDLSAFNGKVNFFNIASPVIYPTLQEAMDDLRKDQYVALIEFTDHKEIVNAVMSSYMEGSWTEFNTRVLKTIVVNEA